MNLDRVHITDVTLRDGHQSLIATRMRTGDMLPACTDLDAIGFYSLEVWGGATFDTCLRFLKEDPWERLKTLRAALPNTRLQMLLRGQNLVGYRHYADDTVRAFVARTADAGMDIFRIFDALNDVRNLRTAIEAVREADRHAQGTICYTVSPVHHVRGFIDMAREMIAMGAQSIAIKDMAGLLTPTATRELVSGLLDALDVPIHLHAHATSGQAEMCHWVAIEAGCRHIETALSAFAGGTSHPPTESMVAALRGTPHDTGLDLDALQRVNRHFIEARRKYKRFESTFTGVDTRVQINQVPGGMISNLANQLREQDSLDQFDAVLLEIPKVREDLGYPPLVTPSSQIVGTQAVMNVLAGERYKTITNEVKQYLKGNYGQAPSRPNPVLVRKAIGAEDVFTGRPADRLDPELDATRESLGELAQSDEDVLTVALFPEVGRKFLEERRDGRLVPEPLTLAETPPGVCPAPTEFEITVHGETYHICVRGTGHSRSNLRPMYVTVDGLPEEVMIEVLDEIELPPPSATDATSDNASARRRRSERRRPTRPGDVATSMPGAVIDVLVSSGDAVTAGQPVLILEAMKMETEVQAPISGTVSVVHVIKGDRANPDETLIEIEPTA